MTDDLAARFRKTYANVPIPERSNPIWVDPEHGAMSWHVILVELDCETECSKRALQGLAQLQII